MKRKESIRAGLAAAACSLIGTGAAAVDLPEIRTAVLFYSEPDRVSAVEGTIRARARIGDERFLNLKLVLDTLTGASANGATAANQVQTFTRPSGNGEYTVAPGETPLDDTFRDTRIDANVSIEIPFRRVYKGAFGAHFSNEYDYRSVSINSSLSRDFNKRNTTASIAVSAGHDVMDPQGGPPIPFASMAPAGAPQPRQTGTKDRDVADMVLGITQIINRSTLVQANYSLTHSSGYHTDPFKIVTVVDGAPGTNQGNPTDYIYENRPDSRTKQSVYSLLKHHLSTDVVDLSYRYLWDDWEVRSHTVELRYRWQWNEKQFLQPQLRYYHQSAAEFYRHSLIDGAALPQNVSADYRLGEFDAYTVAARYGFLFSNGQGINVRVGYYLQMGDSSPPDAIGSLRNQDLFPTVDAIIVQIGYTLGW